jgi:hypothetical protein
MSANKRYYFPLISVFVLGVAVIAAGVWAQVKAGSKQIWSGPGQILLFGAALIGVSLLMLRGIRSEKRKQAAKAEWLNSLPKTPKLRKGKLPPAGHFRAYDLDAKALLGTLPRAQLQSLIDAYSGWGVGENDFLILDETIQALEKKRADADLIAFLKKAKGRKASVEIKWTSNPENAR